MHSREGNTLWNETELMTLFDTYPIDSCNYCRGAIACEHAPCLHYTASQSVANISNMSNDIYVHLDTDIDI